MRLRDLIHPIANICHITLLAAVTISPAMAWSQRNMSGPAGGCFPQLETATARLPQPTAIRDAQGLALLSAAVTALRPDGHTADLGGVVVTTTTADDAGTLQSREVWHGAGQELRIATHIGKDVLIVSTSSLRPFLSMNGTVTSLSPLLSVSLFNPFLPSEILTRRINDINYTVTAPETVDLGGETVQAVTTACGTQLWLYQATKQVWYFDPATHLPLQVHYLVPEFGKVRGYLHARYVFEDFAAVQGITYARKIRQLGIPNKDGDITVQDISIGVPIDNSTFERSVTK